MDAILFIYSSLHIFKVTPNMGNLMMGRGGNDALSVAPPSSPLPPSPHTHTPPLQPLLPHACGHAPYCDRPSGRSLSEWMMFRKYTLQINDLAKGNLWVVCSQSDWIRMKSTSGASKQVEAGELGQIFHVAVPQRRKWEIVKHCHYVKVVMGRSTSSFFRFKNAFSKTSLTFFTPNLSCPNTQTGFSLFSPLFSMD